MSKMRRQGIVVATALVITLASVAVVAALALGGSDTPAYRGSVPPAEIGLPDFTLPDYTGESVSSQELGGKVVLITFLDSQCTESCPIIASQVARAFERLKSEERAQVVPIAISTDPDEDTPEAVRAFFGRTAPRGSCATSWPR